MTAPLPDDEQERLAALGEYDLLDTDPEATYDDIVRLAAFICGTPIAAVSLVDTDRQWFKSILGLDVAETPRDVAFCAHAILRPEVMVIPDAHADARFADNALVTGGPHIRFYAGAPLITESGHALGSLCVIDTVRRDLTPEQKDALQTLARQVAAQMDLSRRVAAQDRLIAERDRAAEATRRSEARFRAAFENAAFGASVSGLDGRFLSVNRAFCTITGYSEAVLLAADALALTHPGDLPEYVGHMDRLRAGQTSSFVTEKRYLRRNGEAVWVQESVSLLRDAQGRPEHILALTEDITDRKEAERAALEAERAEVKALRRTAQTAAVREVLRGAMTTAQMADAVLQALLPIFHADKGLIALLSEGGTVLSTAHSVGVSPADWSGSPGDVPAPVADAVRGRRLVLSPIGEEGAGGVLAALPLQTGERCIGGLGLICPPDIRQDGEQRTFLWTLADQCALALEQARLYDAARHEIEERRWAEETLRESSRALEESQSRLTEAQRIGGIGDWDLDVAARRFTWSAEVFRLLEFDPARGEPDYEAVMARYHPDDRAERDRLFAHTLETGEPYQCDLRLVLPSGTPRWCHLVGRPARDPDGRVTRVVGTAMDITERVVREQQVRDANLILEVQKSQLEAANAELAALATTDPLTGLLNHRTFHARLEEEAARVQRRGEALAVVMVDLDNFKFFNDAYGHGMGDTVLRLVAERLLQVCRPYDTVARFGGDEFVLLMPGIGGATEAEIAQRLRADLAGLTCRPAGAETIPVNLSVGVALFTEMDTDRHETVRQADERLLRAKTGGGVETESDRVRAHVGRSLDGFSMLDALVTAVDNKDRYTRRHSEDVLFHSLMIASELGFDEAQQRTVAVAALLHDVGKIGVPDAVLRKPGKLTEEEFGAVKQHPQMGAVMVGAVPGLEDTLDAVRHHHERWDGGGYPFGLRGEETPLMARLMAVADAFSAMTTDRPYRRGMAPERALAILADGAGTQWDPACVAAFLKAHRTGHGDGLRHAADAPTAVASPA